MTLTARERINQLRELIDPEILAKVEADFRSVPGFERFDLPPLVELKCLNCKAEVRRVTTGLFAVKCPGCGERIPVKNQAEELPQ